MHLSLTIHRLYFGGYKPVLSVNSHIHNELLVINRLESVEDTRITCHTYSSLIPTLYEQNVPAIGIGKRCKIGKG